MAQDLKIRISVDSREGEAAIRRVSSELTGLQTGVERTARASEAATASIARMGHVAAALAAINVSASSVIQAADAWSSLNAQLKIATGSASAGAAAYRDVLAIASQTGQSLEQVGTVYRRFAENASALGMSLGEVADISRTVAQSIALSGGNAASAEAALTQFGQALASGQLRGEELNSVLEQAPRLARALADGLDVPVGKLREMAAAGELTSARLIEALGNSAQKVSADFEQLPLTISRALQNLRTAFTDTVGSFEQSTGLFRGLASGVDLVAKNMDVLGAAGVTVAAVIGGRVVSAVAAATAAKLTDTAAAIRNQQAVAVAAAASQQFAAAKLAEAQASVAAAAGMQRLAVVQSQLIPAQRALAAATAASTAATSAASVSAGLAARALGVLGGPIGLISTALSLGAVAWATWGNKADEATRIAATSARENIQSVIDDLTRLEAGLGAATRKQLDGGIQRGVDTLSETALARDKAERDMLRLREEIARADELGGFRSIGIGAKRDALREIETQHSTLLAREKTLQGQIIALRDQTAQAGIDGVRAFVEANTVGAAKVASQQEALRRAFNQAMDAAGGYNAANPEHVKALDTLNAKLKDLEKTGTKSGAALRTGLGAASKEAGKLADQAERTMKAWSEGITGQAAKDAEALAGVTASMREQLETIGLTSEELTRYRAEKLETAAAAEAHAAAELEAAAALLDLQNQLPDVARSYRELAQARRAASAQLSEQSQITRATAEKQANIDAGQAAKDNAAQAAQEWQRTAAAIEDALIDALMDGGKSGAEYIEGLFRSMVLRPILQAIVQPIAGGITSAMGFGGAPGQGSGGSGGGFGMPGIPGMDTMSMLSQGAQWLGTATGLTGLTSFGTGMAMTSYTSAAAMTGLAEAGLISGVTNAGAASAGSLLGGLSTAMPYVAAALFAAQALGLFDKKPSDKTSSATFDLDSGKISSIWDMGGKKAASQEQKDANSALSMLVGGFAQQAGLDGQIVTAMGGRDGTRLAIEGGFTTPTGEVAGGRWLDGKETAYNYGNGEEAIQKMLDDLIDEGTLPQATIDRWRALKLNADGTARDATELLDTLALINADLSDIEILRADIVQADGEALSAAAGRVQSVMDAINPLTANETWAKATGSVADAFRDIGLIMPHTAEGFGALMDSLDLTSESGREAYASLMDLAPAFLTLTNAIDAAMESINKSTADTIRDIQMSVLDDEGKYSFLDQEIVGLNAKLAIAKDPNEIAALQGQINATTLEAWNLLDKDEQKRLAPQFIGRIEETDATATSRLSVIPDDYSPLALPEDVTAAQTTAAEKTGKAAESLLEAANLFQELIGRMTANSSDGAGALIVAGNALQNAASSLAGAARQTSEVGGY